MQIRRHNVFIGFECSRQERRFVVEKRSRQVYFFLLFQDENADVIIKTTNTPPNLTEVPRLGYTCNGAVRRHLRIVFVWPVCAVCAHNLENKTSDQKKKETTCLLVLYVKNVNKTPACTVRKNVKGARGGKTFFQDRRSKVLPSSTRG